MRYYKMYKEDEAELFEVTKEEAKRTLEGYWNKEELNRIFNNEISFRLWSPFAEVWTETDNGLVPAPGFWGIAE